MGLVGTEALLCWELHGQLWDQRQRRDWRKLHKVFLALQLPAGGGGFGAGGLQSKEEIQRLADPKAQVR